MRQPPFSRSIWNWTATGFPKLRKFATTVALLAATGIVSKLSFLISPSCPLRKGSAPIWPMSPLSS